MGNDNPDEIDFEAQVERDDELLDEAESHVQNALRELRHARDLMKVTAHRPQQTTFAALNVITDDAHSVWWAPKSRPDESCDVGLVKDLANISERND